MIYENYPVFSTFAKESEYQFRKKSMFFQFDRFHPFQEIMAFHQSVLQAMLLLPKYQQVYHKEYEEVILVIYTSEWQHNQLINLLD